MCCKKYTPSPRIFFWIQKPLRAAHFSLAHLLQGSKIHAKPPLARTMPVFGGVHTRWHEYCREQEACQGRGSEPMAGCVMRGGPIPFSQFSRSSSRPNGRLGGRLPGRLVQKTSWSSQRRRSKAACWGTGSSPQTSKTVAQNAKVNTRRPDVARQTPSNSPLKSYT